ALALEDRRVSDARDDVQIAGRAAVAARLALAGHPPLRTGAHAGRDLDLVLLDRPLGARPLAARARLLYHRAAAVAARARLTDRKQALALGLDPAALALGADSRRRPRLGAGAAARRAHLARRHRDRHLRALHRLVEADRHFGLDVPAALRPRPLGAP